MAENSKIEWTHHTVNPWWGCTEVHEGCDNCYARVLSNRWGKDLWGTDKPRMETKNWLNDLHKYQKKAAAAGEMHRVFIGSMMDIFEKPMPVVSWHGDPSTNSNYNTGCIRTLLFGMISSGYFPNLLFLFLTKRPSNINKYIPEAWKDSCPPNVMFGTSVVNQETADKLIPQLLEAPGKKFLSMEPLIGSVDLSMFLPEGSYGINDKGESVFVHKYFMCKCNGCGFICSSEFLDGGGQIADTGDYDDCYCQKCGSIDNDEIFGIDWVIVGGESGHGRRPFNSDWARDLRSQCKEAGVPFFMKQVDKVIPVPDDLLIREFPVI